MTRDISSRAKLQAGLLIAAGMAFFVAAYLGRQVAFAGIGVMFLAMGTAALARAGVGPKS